MASNLRSTPFKREPWDDAGTPAVNTTVANTVDAGSTSATTTPSTGINVPIKDPMATEPTPQEDKLTPAQKDINRLLANRDIIRESDIKPLLAKYGVERNDRIEYPDEVQNLYQAFQTARQIPGGPQGFDITLPVSEVRRLSIPVREAYEKGILNKGVIREARAGVDYTDTSRNVGHEVGEALDREIARNAETARATENAAKTVRVTETGTITPDMLDQDPDKWTGFKVGDRWGVTEDGDTIALAPGDDVVSRVDAEGAKRSAEQLTEARRIVVESKAIQKTQAIQILKDKAEWDKFETDHTRVADGRYIPNDELATIKADYPVQYDILLQHGYDAYVKARGDAEKSLEKFKNKDGSFDIGEALITRDPGKVHAVNLLFRPKDVAKVESDLKPVLTRGTGLVRDPLTGRSMSARDYAMLKQERSVAWTKESPEGTPLSSDQVTASQKYSDLNVGDQKVRATALKVAEQIGAAERVGVVKALDAGTELGLKERAALNKAVGYVQDAITEVQNKTGKPVTIDTARGKATQRVIQEVTPIIKELAARADERLSPILTKVGVGVAAIGEGETRSQPADRLRNAELIRILREDVAPYASQQSRALIDKAIDGLQTIGQMERTVIVPKIIEVGREIGDKEREAIKTAVRFSTFPKDAPALSSDDVTAQEKYASLKINKLDLPAPKGGAVMAMGAAAAVGPATGGGSLAVVGGILAVASALGITQAWKSGGLQKAAESFRNVFGREMTQDDVVVVDAHGNTSNFGILNPEIGKRLGTIPPTPMQDTAKLHPVVTTHTPPSVKLETDFRTPAQDTSKLHPVVTPHTPPYIEPVVYIPGPSLIPIAEQLGARGGMINAVLAERNAGSALRSELAAIDWDTVIGEAKDAADRNRLIAIRAESDRLAKLLPSEVAYYQEQAGKAARSKAARDTAVASANHQAELASRVAMDRTYRDWLAKMRSIPVYTVAQHPEIAAAVKRSHGYARRIGQQRAAEAAYIKALNPMALKGTATMASKQIFAAEMLKRAIAAKAASQMKAATSIAAATGTSAATGTQSAIGTRAAESTKAKESSATKSASVTRTGVNTRATEATRATTAAQAATQAATAAATTTASRTATNVRTMARVRTAEAMRAATLTPILRRDRDTSTLPTLSEAQLKASVAWEMGALGRGGKKESVGYLVPPPYDKKYFWRGQPPPGVQLSPDSDSAIKTIQKVNAGKLPESITGNVGFAGFKVKGTERPTIEFNVVKRRIDGKQGHINLTPVKAGRQRAGTPKLRSVKYGPLWHTETNGGTILSRFPLTRRRRRRARG